MPRVAPLVLGLSDCLMCKEGVGGVEGRAKWEGVGVALETGWVEGPGQV